MGKIDQLKNYVQALDGYKISDTHFKIGAKIHSTDFYYAKRLFQNSYYTARIALLLAIRINDRIKNKENPLQTPLTIAGYEMYSELLLSLIKKFLNEFGHKDVNHFVTLDIDDQVKHEPRDVSIHGNVVIVVPIASTGSTAVKIENYVKGLNSTHKVHSPHFNVLLAFDEEFDLSENLYAIGNEQDPVIRLATHWESPANCKWCFENDLSRPLFETDKSSLTPTLIFDLPSAKTITENTLNVDFDDVDFREAIIYRKTKRNNEHFLFSTNTEVLIKRNESEIEKWLAGLKVELSQKLGLGPANKIVIISPCHYSNTTFINLVNDKLFNSSATIIHHQTDIDYLTNFKLLNKNYLNQLDAKIFFVDDSLISGRHFFNIYDLFRFTADYEKRLSGAIFLSNKSSPDIHKRVSRATEKNVYSFVNINLPLPPRVSNQKPLDHEIKRYSDLSKFALNDVLKKRFHEKSKDLNGEENTRNTTTINTDKKISRHLKMFKATHKIYAFFGNKIDTDISDLSFEDLLSKCSFKLNEIEDKTAVMKVLSQYPFLLYLPLRKKTFAWHKNWFKARVQGLKEKTTLGSGEEPNSINYDDLRELKFLLRRAVFLVNYEVLSNDFFALVKRIFEIIGDAKNVYKLAEKNKADLYEPTSYEKVPLTDVEIQHLNDFHIFLLIQYVELIQKNAWCAARLVQNIEMVTPSIGAPRGKQFLRMLRIETGAVLNDFYALFSKDKKWEELYKFRTVDGLTTNERNNKIVLDENNSEILGYLRSNDEILKSNRFEISNRVLKLKDDAGNLNDGFLNFLWVKHFLNADERFRWGDISLSDKTEAIFHKLKGVFDTSSDVGAFFIVADGSNSPHLVFDQDGAKNRFLKELDPEKHQILFDFLKGVPAGEKDKSESSPESESENINDAIQDEKAKPKRQEKASELKSIIEFNHLGDGQWEDTYSLTIPADQESFVDAGKWLLMIRVSDSEFKTLGLMGFYAEENLQDDRLAKQLLMLLRKDIGQFIQKHHKNDEFSALREAEATKRFAYLAGHGRQMLQRLSKEYSPIYGDVVGTMEKLQYLFATKLISASGNSQGLKENINKDLFNSMFLNSTILKTDIDEIIRIGNHVYNTKIIENRVECNVLTNPVSDQFSFPFNNKILTLICFELFVNAKKNRFHFISKPCPTCHIETNSLDLRLDVNDEKLTVTLVGTGPSIPPDIKKKIDGGEDVKDGTEIAGLYMITKILKILDDQNTISIDGVEKCGSCGINENTVKVELRSKNNA